MNLAAVAIKNRNVTYFTVFLLVVGGMASFFALGQLEDPEYTVKTAVITTDYPGGSPEEVELEITDRIELALQELPQVKYLESFSRAGFSLVKVEIKSEYWSDQMPQVWDEMRRKVRDIEDLLPPGAGRPDISDDFGDVFGFQLALVGDGFTYAEMERWAKDLKKELGVVEGVARVDLWGIQHKIIYFDISQTQLSSLGLTDASIVATLNRQNMVVDAGSVDHQTRRFRIAPTGTFKDPTDIANLNVRASLADELANLLVEVNRRMGTSRTSELVRLGDIGEIRRGYLEPPFTLMRFNGRPAIGLSITNRAGINVVDVGRRIDQRLDEIMPHLPVGIELSKVHWQSDIVAEAVNGFLVNFAQAVAIVLIVLTLAMGWRMGLIIGTALILTILASFILMAIWEIDLQRMSLGALVIALGMMVDNAIVVADGMSVRLQRGMGRKQAAIEAASQPAIPLLGATVIAVMAFYPIFASVEGAGEYCRSLFQVVGISLLASWVISVTVTPVQCIDMLPAPKTSENDDPYAGKLFQQFRTLLSWAIGKRLLFLGSMAGVLVMALVGFGQVRQLFFPDSSMPKFMIDYWAPEGTRIEEVARDIRRAEAHLRNDDRVAAVSTFIGSGPPRFYLPVEPELPYASYAQFIVNVHDYKDVIPLLEDLQPWFDDTYPQALVALRQYGVGPSNTWKLELRISGPAVADADVLRDIAGQAVAILENDPVTAYARTNWRQRVQRIDVLYNEERSRWAAVTREDIGNSTKRAYDGLSVGLYREQDDLIPIIIRFTEKERQDVENFDILQIQPYLRTTTVPLAQVIDGLDLAWEDPLIWRRDRRRTITVQANPILGETFPTLMANVAEQINQIELPPEYTMTWGGEYEDTEDSQASLIPGVIPAGAVMAFIIVALFNAFRPPLVILLTIPFAVIGITIGLLTFDVPFGFLALLGAMSLVGMMIKNAIVLLDEVNILLAAGQTPYDAVIGAALSRLRPVVLAAATTVLGVIPLLQDAFWIGMAVTVMAGLAFGTGLTMVVVPVLYATLHKIPAPDGKS